MDIMDIMDIMDDMDIGRIAVCHRFSAFNFPLPQLRVSPFWTLAHKSHNFQLSTFNFQFSIFNCVSLYIVFSSTNMDLKRLCKVIYNFKLYF